jgi:hypothetical protein
MDTQKRTPYKPAGAIALQQALRIEFNLTYAEVARLTKVHPRTVWQHINRAAGGTVQYWENRSPEQQNEAIANALRVIALDKNLHATETLAHIRKGAQ